MATTAPQTNGSPTATAGQRPPNGSLYVGDLPQDLPNPEDTLFNLFSKIGMVMSIKVCRDINSQRSLGYAYVNFQNPGDADTALERLNFTEIRPGKPIRIMWSIRDPTLRKAGNANLFIKNLDPEIDNKTLRETFQVFGPILSCKLATSDDGKSLGYGFVHFETDENASEAVAKLDGMKMGSQEVNVSRFVKKADRDREEEKVFTDIYVKNLKDSVAEDDVKSFLAPHGSVTSIFIGTNPHHASKFALVTMDNHAGCLEVIEKYHEKDHALAAPDQKLYVARALKKRDRQAAKIRDQQSALLQSQGRNVYVKHLDDSITQEKFEELFAQFGEIVSAKIMKDQDGTPRGFGFVCFGSKEAANAAIREMNGKMLFRRPLYVSQAQQKDSRHTMLEEQRKAMLAQQQRMAMQMPMHGGQFFGGAPPGMQPGFMARPMGFPMGMQGPAQFAMMSGMRGGPPMARPPQPRMVRPPMGQFPNVAHPPQFGQMGMPQPQPMPRYTQQPMPQQPVRIPQVAGISSTDLTKMSPEEQKNALGERLYAKIQEFNPAQAAKITGMLLEMDTPEILNVLEDHATLTTKINEAVAVLRQHAN